jgi:hypothetical protein
MLRVIKTSGLILLSALVVYSGAAWALSECLLRDDTGGQANVTATARQAINRLPASDVSGHHTPLSQIHCAFDHLPLGPMIVNSSAFRSPASKPNAIPAKARLADSDALLSQPTADQRGLGSPRARNDIARHLFLSVLRI